jgi:hypothetical protein
MPISADSPYPRRYNSLRLSGHDYAQTNSLYFITIDAFESRPLFEDLIMAKKTLSTLLHPNLTAIIRVHAFTLMPEHLHLLAGVCKLGRRLSASLGSFKSFSTRAYWKRGREIAEGGQVVLSAPPSAGVFAGLYNHSPVSSYRPVFRSPYNLQQWMRKW